MKVELNMAAARNPARLKVTAVKRTVAIEIQEPYCTALLAIKMTRSDAQRLADAILAAMKEQA